MILYYRIYYTIYRIILKFSDLLEIERESPRSEAVLMLSLFIMLDFVAALFLISHFTRIPTFSGKKIYIILAFLPIVAFNFLVIFYKGRYRIIENKLSRNWDKEKRMNVLITVLYFIITFLFL